MAQDEIRVSNVSREEFKEMQGLLEKNSKLLGDMAIKYNNRFEKVIADQQTELDRYHEGIVKEILNATFKSIAAVYDEGNSALSKVPDGNFDLLKTRYKEMLDSVLQVLFENDVEEYKSEIGSPYSRSKCKVLGKKPTGDKEFIGQVVKSYNTGFYRGAAVLVPELVDIYTYDASLDKSDKNEEAPGAAEENSGIEGNFEITETPESKTEESPETVTNAEPEITAGGETEKTEETSEDNTPENN